MNTKMNKKGTEKFLGAYWFGILFIVAGAVVYMAAVFYGAPYDVRELEANALVNQVADCLTENGKLKQDVFVEGEEGGFSVNENFLESCALNFEVEEYKDWKDDQFYVEVNFFNFKDYNGLGYREKPNMKKGEDSLRDISVPEKTTFPYFVEREFYTLNFEENEKFIVKIKSIIRKTEKNVK
jgi:hypothetical protein